MLHPTPVSTKRFSYHKADNVFAADASDLLAPSRVYEDACDLGYTLVSEKTGREIVFVESAHSRDGEGELLYTEYRPAQENGGTLIGTALGAREISMRVYND